MDDDSYQGEIELYKRQQKILDELIRERGGDKDGSWNLRDCKEIAERMTSYDLDLAVKWIEKLGRDHYIKEYVKYMMEEQAIRLERLLLGDAE